MATSLVGRLTEGGVIVLRLSLAARPSWCVLFLHTNLTLCRSEKRAKSIRIIPKFIDCRLNQIRE